MKALLKGGSSNLKEVEVNSDYPPFIYLPDNKNTMIVEKYKLKIINKSYLVYFYEN